MNLYLENGLGKMAFDWYKLALIDILMNTVLLWSLWTESVADVSEWMNE